MSYRTYLPCHLWVTPAPKSKRTILLILQILQFCLNTIVITRRVYYFLSL